MNEATSGGSLIKDGRGCGTKQRLITATNIAINGDKGHAKQRGKWYSKYKKAVVWLECVSLSNQRDYNIWRHLSGSKVERPTRVTPYLSSNSDNHGLDSALVPIIYVLNASLTSVPWVPRSTVAALDAAPHWWRLLSICSFCSTKCGKIRKFISFLVHPRLNVLLYVNFVANIVIFRIAVLCIITYSQISQILHTLKAVTSDSTSSIIGPIFMLFSNR